MPLNSLVDPENICARCSATFGSCCIAVPGCGYHSTFVSDDEARVIEKYISGSENLFTYETNTVEFIKYAGSLFPDYPDEVVRCFPLNGKHRSLHIDCFGRCRFLSGNGCILPSAIRPGICRIYPFWIIRGDLKLFTNDRCLAQQEASDIPGQLLLFQMSENDVKKIYEDIIHAWFGKNRHGK